MAFCLLTFAAGIVLATCVPAMQFAAGLLLVAGSGFVEALWFGSRILPTLGWSVAFFALSQVGYAVGLGLFAVLRGRRSGKGAVGRPSPTDLAAPQAVNILRTAISDRPTPDGTPGHTIF